MKIPDNLRYTKDHEWADTFEGNKVRVGITDYAQDALGDVVFVQLPNVGTEVKAGDSFSEVESTKSVSDVYAPVSGTVTAVNPDLEQSPQFLNEDPYGKGWLCVIESSEAGESAEFMDAEGYRNLVEHD